MSPAHIFGKSPAELRAAKAERRANRVAHVTVRSLVVACPYCEERVPPQEDDDAFDHDECDFAEAGRRECGNCRETFTIPKLASCFRRIRP